MGPGAPGLTTPERQEAPGHSLRSIAAISGGTSSKGKNRQLKQSFFSGTSTEHSELVALRREECRLEMENEILRRAAVYFASATLPE